MAALEATCAVEELLLQQRSLVDHTLYPLLENAALGDLLIHFQSTVLDLQRQEPSFWQLQVVEFIRNVLKSRVGGCVQEAVSAAAVLGEQQDPARVVARVKSQVQRSFELEETLQQLQSDVEQEVTRLTEMLNGEGKEDQRRSEDTDEHFLTQFWEKLQQVVERRERHSKSDEEREAEGVEGVSDSCSFERLTFDDDSNDLSRSAMSFPCMEDFPTTVRRMQSTDMVERATGLDELMQMPIVEIIHSGPIFPAACSAVVGLFLDTDIRGERCDSAERAKRVINDLVNQVEDAAQFLEVYWAVLDFMGSHLETEELFLYRQDVCTSTDARSVAVLDCFRVLHSLVCRVIRHWVYFSTEALAQLLHSTFWLLTMYSKAEAGVEAKRINPLMMVSLIDEHPMQWFKLWLLNCPTPRQLFVAIDESGFIADLLQTLSRVWPLTPIKSSNTSTDAVEKRTVQCALIILSYACEYQAGRELVSRWQRIPAHAYIKQRRTTWDMISLETIAAENDALYRTVRPTVSEEDPRDELGAAYEHLGAGAIDALVLSIVSMIASTPKQLQDGNGVSYNDQWTKCISDSVASYLLTARLDTILAELVKVVDICWAHCSSKIYPTAENEETNPWFPFRQPKSVTEVCRLVIDSISKRTRCGILNSEEVQITGQLILQVMISSKVITGMPNFDTTRLIFKLCKRFIQSWTNEAMSRSEQKPNGIYQSKLLELITDITTLPKTFKVANESGVIEELWKACSLLSTRDDEPKLFDLSGHIVASLCHSAAGVRYIHDSPIVNAYLHGVYKSHAFETLIFRKLLGCLSLPIPAKAFFSLDGVQATVSRVVTNLQENADFTVALNSPDDECPSQLSDLMGPFQLLRCCLSTQFAASSLLSIEHSPLVQFIVETLATHKEGACMRSCQAEDICCVAFQLVLSLVSSVPTMLECSGLLSELELLNLNAMRTLQRDLLCNDSEPLGSCSYLEKQLCYAFEFVGGSCEKLPQYELFAFEDTSWQHNSIHKNSTGAETLDVRGISDFAFTLQNKILQTIKDGVESDSLAPMDFVLISQVSWELITDLETEPVVKTTSVASKSVAAFTEIFAKLMYNLVMSKRSRLEPPVNSMVDEQPVDTNTTTSSSQNDDAFYPTDSERKLMNRLYKNYAHGLSLAASPTLLHCIVKTFGKVAIDCFPVTVLMALYPTYEEADILRFLAHCITNPSAGFLWPRSVVKNCDGIGGDMVPSPATAIAEGVEIIMEREFPQVLQVIDQCQCSLSSLVLRWHSQNFFNYFDWENVVIYSYLSILYGAEFQVYIIVAILKHLEPTMRELTAKHSSQSLAPFLTLIREPIRNFRFSSWRSLVLRLRSEYHKEVTMSLTPAAVHGS